MCDAAALLLSIRGSKDIITTPAQHDIYSFKLQTHSLADSGAENTATN
jgi:hypothetical protein